MSPSRSPPSRQYTLAPQQRRSYHHHHHSSSSTKQPTTVAGASFPVIASWKQQLRTRRREHWQQQQQQQNDDEEDVERAEKGKKNHSSTFSSSTLPFSPPQTRASRKRRLSKRINDTNSHDESASSPALLSPFANTPVNEMSCLPIDDKSNNNSSNNNSSSSTSSSNNNNNSSSTDESLRVSTVWVCPQCTLANRLPLRFCHACNARRPISCAVTHAPLPTSLSTTAASAKGAGSGTLTTHETKTEEEALSLTTTAIALEQKDETIPAGLLAEQTCFADQQRIKRARRTEHACSKDSSAVTATANRPHRGNATHEKHAWVRMEARLVQRHLDRLDEWMKEQAETLQVLQNGLQLMRREQSSLKQLLSEQEIYIHLSGSSSERRGDWSGNSQPSCKPSSDSVTRNAAMHARESPTPIASSTLNFTRLPPNGSITKPAQRLKMVAEQPSGTDPPLSSKRPLQQQQLFSSHMDQSNSEVHDGNTRTNASRSSPMIASSPSKCSNLPPDSSIENIQTQPKSAVLPSSHTSPPLPNRPQQNPQTQSETADCMMTRVRNASTLDRRPQSFGADGLPCPYHASAENELGLSTREKVSYGKPTDSPSFNRLQGSTKTHSSNTVIGRGSMHDSISAAKDPRPPQNSEQIKSKNLTSPRNVCLQQSQSHTMDSPLTSTQLESKSVNETVKCSELPSNSYPDSPASLGSTQTMDPGSVVVFSTRLTATTVDARRRVTIENSEKSIEPFHSCSKPFLGRESSLTKAAPFKNSTNQKRESNVNRPWISNQSARNFLQSLEDRCESTGKHLDMTAKAANLKEDGWQTSRRSLSKGTSKSDPGSKQTQKDALWDDNWHCDDEEEEEPNYAYKETVRCKAKRQGLPCYDCLSCRRFYEALRATGHDIDQLKPQQQLQFSRHRAKHRPTETPVDFWELDFADERDKK